MAERHFPSSQPPRCASTGGTGRCANTICHVGMQIARAPGASREIERLCRRNGLADSPAAPSATWSSARRWCPRRRRRGAQGAAYTAVHNGFPISRCATGAHRARARGTMPRVPHGGAQVCHMRRKSAWSHTRSLTLASLPRSPFLQVVLSVLREFRSVRQVERLVCEPGSTALLQDHDRPVPSGQPA